MAEASGLQFFTPSYAGDLDRFVLLRQSVKRFARCPVQHVVAVPRRDVAAFRRAAEGEDCRVVAQEDFVEPYFYAPAWSRYLQQALGERTWRLRQSRFGGRPGWIVQQIVKLSAPEVFADGEVCLVDSDLVFIRDFDRRDFLPASGARVLLRMEPEGAAGRHPHYMRKSRELLKLPAAGEDHHFMAYPAIWYMDWVRALRNELVQRHQKPWQKVLYDAGFFSEYLLYGVYLDEIVRPEGLFERLAPFHVGVWDRAGFDRLLQNPQSLVAAYPAHQAPLSLVVQSNLGLDPSAYAEAIKTSLFGSVSASGAPR